MPDTPATDAWLENVLRQLRAMELTQEEADRIVNTVRSRIRR